MTLRTEKRPDPAYLSELKTLGDHIRTRRLDLGLEQKDVARIVGAAECSVWNWENNEALPSIRFTPKIYQFLGYCPF